MSRQRQHAHGDAADGRLRLSTGIGPKRSISWHPTDNQQQGRTVEGHILGDEALEVPVAGVAPEVLASHGLQEQEGPK